MWTTPNVRLDVCAARTVAPLSRDWRRRVFGEARPRTRCRGDSQWSLAKRRIVDDQLDIDVRIEFGKGLLERAHALAHREAIAVRECLQVTANLECVSTGGARTSVSRLTRSVGKSEFSNASSTTSTARP